MQAAGNQICGPIMNPGHEKGYTIFMLPHVNFSSAIPNLKPPSPCSLRLLVEKTLPSPSGRGQGEGFFRITVKLDQENALFPQFR